MTFFEDLKQKAREDPKIIVLPEFGMDKDGVIANALEQAVEENIAIPIGLTREMMEQSGKADELAAEYLKLRGKDPNLKIGVGRRAMQDPIAFATMMVRQSYAHGMVAGRYTESGNIVKYVNPLIGIEQGKISCAIFFKETPPEFRLFDLLAIADVVVNPAPDTDQLYRIIITAADAYHSFTGREPTIAIRYYVTNKPKLEQVAQDPELKKIMDALEKYKQGSHPWEIFMAQPDAYLLPDVARRKGIISEVPVDLVIGPNLGISNSAYKDLQHYIAGGNYAFLTVGLKRSCMDCSRAAGADELVNTIAGCSRWAQILEQRGKYGKIAQHFLNL